MRKVAAITALWAFVPSAALAASFTAVAVTGYNYGGIVPNTAAAPYSSTSASLDATNDALFQAGLAATTAGGLPQTGTLGYSGNSNAYTFVLGPYGGSNLLRINPTGSLTLTAPASFTNIAILGFTTGNSGAGGIEMVGDVTLHFSGGTSSVYSKAIDLSDWFAATPPNPNVVASAAGGLVNITAGSAAAAFEATSGGPKFYVSLVTLTGTDSAKTLTSIGFGNFPLGGNGFQFVMAIDGLTPPVPTPPIAVAPVVSGWGLGALTLLLVGAALAAIRRLS